MSNVQPARQLEELKRICHYTTQNGICGKPTEYCFHASESGKLYLCSYHYGVLMAAMSMLNVDRWPDERG